MKENIVGLVRQRQFGKSLTATAWSVFGLCLLVFLSLALIPLSWVTYDQGREKTIIIVNPLVSRAQLILATMLIGIRYGFRCYMGYDFQSHQFRGKPIDGAGDLKGISPFILIGDNTEMDPEDVKGVVDHIKSHTKNNNDNGYPRLNVIEAALDHPNLKVRLLAKELVTIISLA